MMSFIGEFVGGIGGNQHLELHMEAYWEPVQVSELIQKNTMIIHMVVFAIMGGLTY